MTYKVKRDLGYSLRRYYVDTFFLKHIAPLSSHSKILDLGGHKTKKRGQFDIRQYDLNVLTLNIGTGKGADIQADAGMIPLQNKSIDTVICAELLEHVYQPKLVIRETFRILKENGTLFITVPFLFRIHADPYDYGRYTDYYWQTLLIEGGFSQIKIERQGAFHSVFTDLCKMYANNLKIPRPFGRIIRWGMLYGWIAPLQKWVLWREQRLITKPNNFLQSYTTGFGIVAVKPYED